MKHTVRLEVDGKEVVRISVKHSFGTQTIAPFRMSFWLLLAVALIVAILAVKILLIAACVVVVFYIIARAFEPSRARPTRERQIDEPDPRQGF